MAFLLPIAAVCAGKASEPAAATAQLLPYTYLYMKHPQGPLASVAHTSFGNLLSSLCEAGQAELAAKALPYYAHRWGGRVLPKMLRGSQIDNG